MPEQPFEFNPDITCAVTIPAGWYTDPGMLDRELQTVFRASWQFACALEDVAVPGSYATAGVAGVPVVITRDMGGVLRAFCNVCRHRAGTVAVGCGERRTLQCGYHGWTYALDGSLLQAPEFDGARDFDKKDFGLIPIRLETWDNFVFVNFDDHGPPLLDVLGNIPGETSRFSLASMRRVARRDYHLKANWKLYIDNYLEGYHIPVAHPGLFRELDYANYRVETFAGYSHQHAPIRPVRDAGSTQRRYNLEGDPAARYYWIFPNLTLNIYQGMLQTNVIVPLSHDRTLVMFEWYLPEDATVGTRQVVADSMRFSDEIQAEDTQICEDVWRNLLSGVYVQGRYNPARENGVHHFHGLLAERVSEGA